MHGKHTRLIALVGGLALSASACGSDGEDGTDGSAEGGGASAVTVTIGADGIEAPAEIPAGAVTVAIEGTAEEFTEVNFSRVEAGMTEDEFTEGLASVLGGGAFPDGFLDTAGAVTGPDPIAVVLEPGEYFVWTEDPEADGGEGEEGPPSFFVSPATVTGEAGGELPETDGTITARDYGFEVDVAASAGTFTFRNDGPDQFHHAVIFDFGDVEPDVVEENLPAFMASDGEDVPEALQGVDVDDAGGSGVFGPGSSGTFAATLEAGRTYAAVCFIQDRTGGPPHVIAHDMFEVFTVG